MSGSRTKQLRRECRERLGRAPLKAEGHVTHRATTIKGTLRRVWAALKPNPIQVDEFRFFKRRGCTPEEERAARWRFLGACAKHKAAVERNNDHMRDLCLAREVA